jgi:hypothetical protein
MTANRAYDNRRVEFSPEDSIRLDLPDEPPRLTPQAARVLLRILIKAHDQLVLAAPSQEGDAA